jgi:hypothetical protein
MFVYMRVCVCKRSTYIVTNERLHEAAFMYLHLTHKVLSLSNADLPNVPLSRNVISASNEGLL